MGLDMYLVIKNEDGRIDWQQEEVAYWRKANQIHKWFVVNVQNGVDNCEPYEVTKEVLEKLLQTCQDVLKDPSRSAELLPTKGGFFFGSTDYDEDYFEVLSDTIDRLEHVLNNFDFEHQTLVYCSSW